MNVSRACVVRGRECIVSGGVGCSVVRVVVSGLRCWGVVGLFPGLLFVGVCLMGLSFPGLVAALCGLVGTPPGGD